MESHFSFLILLDAEVKRDEVVLFAVSASLGSSLRSTCADTGWGKTE
jgi:hypothetical protein